MIQLGCQMAALTVAAGQEDRCDMLLVVRHADAGDKGSWGGPDVGRPLSPEGRCQAEGLVVRLEDYPVDRILCSPTVRCHQTVQPLAEDRLLGIDDRSERLRWMKMPVLMTCEPHTFDRLSLKSNVWLMFRSG